MNQWRGCHENCKERWTLFISKARLFLLWHFISFRIMFGCLLIKDKISKCTVTQKCRSNSYYLNLWSVSRCSFCIWVPDYPNTDCYNWPSRGGKYICCFVVNQRMDSTLCCQRKTKRIHIFDNLLKYNLCLSHFFWVTGLLGFIVVLLSLVC